KAGTNSIYQILITKPNTQIRFPDNTDGHADTNPGQVYSTESNWGGKPLAGVPAQSPNPVYGQTGGIAMGGEQGFFLIRPQNAMGAPITFPGTGAGDVPTANLDLSTQSMSVKIPVTDLGDPAVAGKGVDILLRRLACPHIPANDPNSGTFDATKPLNPYITVDYVQTRHSTVVGGSDELNDATTISPPRPESPQAPSERLARGRDPPVRGAPLPPQPTAPSTTPRPASLYDPPAAYPGPPECRGGGRGSGWPHGRRGNRPDFAAAVRLAG